MKCDVCGEGNLKSCSRERRIEYGGSIGTVLLHFSSCDTCRSEIVNEEQSLLNRRNVNRFKKMVDRVPLGAQIRSMRRAAKLTQVQAGALLGGGPVAFSKYENDDLLPDTGMATLLRLLIADPSLVERIKAQKNEMFVMTRKSLDESSQPDSRYWIPSVADDDDIEVVAPVVVESQESFSGSVSNLWEIH